MSPRLSIIVAMAENGVIGRDGKLPWPRIAEDMKWFKEKTMGKACVMGRKTFDSIGKPLTGRANVVVTRDRDWKRAGVYAVHEFDEAVGVAASLDPDADEIMVIGGAQIYAKAVPHAARIYLTHIHKAYEGDARFPKFNRNQWREISREERDATKDLPPISYIVLDRI